MITKAKGWVAALALAVACSGKAANEPDSNGCCPPDAELGSCMHLGGYSPGGCGRTCDFYCSTNWRIENDANNCPVWKYDTRAPLPSETQLCFPTPDAATDSATD